MLLTVGVMSIWNSVFIAVARSMTRYVDGFSGNDTDDCSNSAAYYYESSSTHGSTLQVSALSPVPVSYTHLTLPTILLV